MNEISRPDIIKRFRDRFYEIGNTDELGIIESLGFFLLANYSGEFSGINSQDEISLNQILNRLNQIYPNSELPQPPQFRYVSTDKNKLTQEFLRMLSVLEKDELGSFYEFSIQCLLTEMKTGGRYITPRHITKFMGDIGRLGTNRSLADFACGSGGILLNAKIYNLCQVSGYEISINWARVAFTNLILHGIKDPKIIAGDSFIVLEDDNYFDSIVMNPPFGMKINTRFHESSHFGDYSSQSEIAFLQLGLDHLSQQGTLITLLPSGFLFSTGKQNESVKRHLIQNSLLRSVVTFPDDTFQPYSNIQTHLVEIKNKQTIPPDNLTWFYQPRYDGYTAGRNRKEDLEHNDLPLIKEAMTWKNSGDENTNRNTWFTVDRLKADGDQCYRIALNPRNSSPTYEQKVKDNLMSTARFGLSVNGSSFIFKYKEEERDNISAFFNEERFQSSEKTLSRFKLSKSKSQDFPTSNLKIVHKDIKGYFISSKGVQKDKKYEARIKTLHSDAPHKNTGYLCFILQPDIGYYSKQMLMDNTDWLPKNLQPPCILPIESPDQSVSEDYPFYLVIWDDTQLSGYQVKGEQNTLGYFRSLSSGEDLLMVEINQKSNDYYFIFFDQKLLNPLPEKTEGVLLNHEGVVLGVGVTKEVIENKRYDIMPSTYIPERKETEDILLPPAYILGNIKKNQIELSNALDSLLQLVENKLPSENQHNPPQYPLLKYLDEELKTKWINIPENYFQLTDLNDFEIDQQSLDLLVSLGLLLKVRIGESINYRCLENSDIQGKEPYEN